MSFGAGDNAGDGGGQACPVARLDDVAVSFRGRRVLDGVDLELARGLIFVLLGINGAGKTTLMRTLCGRLAPGRGRVAILGRDPLRDKSARRAIGFVPQSMALYPTLTVRENLAAFSAFSAFARRGRGEASKRVDAVLEEVRVGTVADTRLGDLSGGYQRRVNLGAALVAEPALLLLDEPTVGLDADSRQVLVDIVKGLARAGTSVLLVTHDFDVATAIADHIGFLSEGRITVKGRPAELIERFFERRVAVRVQCARQAEPAVAELLTGAGLAFSSADACWRSPPEGVGPDAGERVLAATSSSPGLLRSLQLEQPGLPQLYDLLTGGGLHG